jgi:hypothetical protein
LAARYRETCGKLLHVSRARPYSKTAELAPLTPTTSKVFNHEVEAIVVAKLYDNCGSAACPKHERSQNIAFMEN